MYGERYVNLVSYNKYASRTADTSELVEVKEMMGQYINDGEWFAPKLLHGLFCLFVIIMPLTIPGS